MAFDKIVVPSAGEKITLKGGKLHVPDKPIIAYSKIQGEDAVKISARTLDVLTQRGLNLGEIMRIAAETHGGTGGGHNIAAGAQVPIKNLEAFLARTDKLVQEQLGKT